MDQPDLSAPAVRDLRRRVALACRILYQQGLADYLGHPSARIEDTPLVVIKPRFSMRVKGHGTMTAEQMLIVDLDGRIYAGDDPPPSAPAPT